MVDDLSTIQCIVWYKLACHTILQTPYMILSKAQFIDSVLIFHLNL